MKLKQRSEYLALLEGEGIEIGALHRPCDAPHLRVSYVDRLTKQQALVHYPELAGLDLVDVDIVDDGEVLSSIADGSQDFVIANHVIEHMVDPIKSLLTWRRVLKEGGRLFLAVPDKNTTFDQDREVTSIDHLVQDYEDPCQERDFEHFKDFALKVSCRTFGVKPESESESFAEELFKMGYSIHYHVWDQDAFKKLLNFLPQMFPEWDLEIIESMDASMQEFIFVLQKRVSEGRLTANC